MWMAIDDGTRSPVRGGSRTPPTTSASGLRSGRQAQLSADAAVVGALDGQGGAELARQQLAGVEAEAGPPGALAVADQLLGIDSESEEGHYQRGLSLRELRRPEEAARAEDRYLKFRRRVEQEQALRDRFRRNYPDLADEDAPAHIHDLRGPS